MCLVIMNPKVTAGLKWAIDTLPNMYTPTATPINGRKAINGSPSIPLNLASITTAPVARTTTMNVPITSARNLFWVKVSLSAIIFFSDRSVCCKFLDSPLNLISDFSNFFDWFVFWIFDTPID